MATFNSRIVPVRDGADILKGVVYQVSNAEFLLKKYAGGRIPPLIPHKGQSDEHGLLNGHLVEIYQHGFSGAYSLDLGILAAEDMIGDAKGKWHNAEYRANEFAVAEWTPFCKAVRGVKEGEKACKDCDRFFAAKAEQKRDIICYVCSHGLIDFAVPVSLDGRVAAVLFSGQRRPKPGTRWNPEMAEEGGLCRALAPGEKGIDLWPFCQEKIRAAEKRFGFSEGRLLKYLEEDAENGSRAEVSPAEVEKIMLHLRKARDHLSRLATMTFHLEKFRVIAWIRSRLAQCLRHLTAKQPAMEQFWKSLSSELQHVNSYFGSDYVAVISSYMHPEPAFRVLAISTKDERAEATFKEEIPAKRDAVLKLVRTVEGLEETEELDSSLYASPLKSLTGEATAGKDIVYPVFIPLDSPRGAACLIAMGRDRDDFLQESIMPVDREAVNRVLGDVSLVVEVALLVEELQKAANRQASFVLDMSHDLRNPIQNIVFKADRLKRGLVSPSEVPKQAKKIAAQVKRLHLLSERVWTLEAFEAGRLQIQQGVRVNVYEVLRECRDSLQDIASACEVTIEVDASLERWPAVELDRKFFTQAVLNLLDNGVKYSTYGTEVRVDGKVDGHGRHISVVNRGLDIKPHEQEEIFRKFFRTYAAQQRVREGTGIGLFLVKKFAEIYGDVQVKSQAIEGTKDHVTEFILTIKKG